MSSNFTFVSVESFYGGFGADAVLARSIALIFIVYCVVALFPKSVEFVPNELNETFSPVLALVYTPFLRYKPPEGPCVLPIGVFVLYRVLQVLSCFG